MAVVTANLPRPETVNSVDIKELVGAEEYDKNHKEHPGTIKAFVVCKDPRITVVPHAFSEAECQHLIELVDGYWMPSLVGQATYSSDAEYSKGDLENTLSNTRTSWSCMMRYAQTSVVESMENRLAAIAGLPVSQLERFNMVRYAPGELFDEHHDGKFRPVTVFVYLNDLAEEDDGGDTYFPYLGLSFRPRRGTAVVWKNADPTSGEEDSRMLHAARPPKLGIKYGVNCFFNNNDMRQLMAVSETPPTEANLVRISELGKDRDQKSDKLVAYRLCQDPKIMAVPAFCSPEEVQHLLELLQKAPEKCSSGLCHAVGDPGYSPTRKARSQNGEGSGGVDAYPDATQVRRPIEPEETEIVAAIERRLTGVSGLQGACLGRLRIVRPGLADGFCNRGCGPKSAYICLSEGFEDVFFARLGICLRLQKGDLLMWQNADWELLGTPVEDVRTWRYHARPAEDQENSLESLIGIDAFFHDNPVRLQQSTRPFVRDAEVEVREAPCT